MRDLITPIHLGDLVYDAPAAYFRAGRVPGHTVLHYNFFHRYDYATGHYLRRKLDSHDFDFEGIMMLIPDPFTDHSWARYLVTQFHHELRIHETPPMMYGRYRIRMEAGGHGIKLQRTQQRESENTLTYRRYHLINIVSPDLRPECIDAFNEHGVHWPDQVNHWLIRRKMGKESDGLWWRDPLGFIDAAKKCLVI